MRLSLAQKKLRPVIVLGAGGHSKVVINVLNKLDRTILGVTDPNKTINETFFDMKILGSDEIINQYRTDEIELVNGVGNLPNDNTRALVSNRFEDLGYKFTTIIHPTAEVSENVTLLDSVQIMAGCIIQPGVIIGKNSIINTGAIIDHDCQIGSNCHIAPGVTLSGGVQIDNNTHIGTGTVVIQNIVIGENVIVGAGSIVVKDIKDDTKFIQPRRVSGN